MESVRKSWVWAEVQDRDDEDLNLHNGTGGRKHWTNLKDDSGTNTGGGDLGTTI